MQHPTILFDDLHSGKQFSSGELGVIHRMTHKSNKTKHLFVKTLRLESGENPIFFEREADLWLKLHLKSKPKAIPNLYNFTKNSLGMGDIGFCYLFDFYPKSMFDLISDLKNKKIKGPFPFRKIVSLASHFINAMAFLQKIGACLREMKPSCIFLDEEENDLHFIDIAESKDILLFGPAKFKKEIASNGSLHYFSPELLLAFKNEEKPISINPFKCDVFSFGLMILELGVLELPVQDEDSLIWQKNIENSLQNFKNTYLPLMNSESEKIQIEEFLKTLKKCLILDPSKRPDFINLFCRNIRVCDSDTFEKHVLVSEKSNDFVQSHEEEEVKKTSNVKKLSPEQDSQLKLDVNLVEKMVSIEIRSKEKIKDLKERLKSVWRLPNNLLKLMFQRQILEDDLTLADYDIKSKNCLFLHLITEIQLTIFINEKDVFPVQIRGDDEIGKLKALIQESKGIPIQSQKLFFKGEELSSWRKIMDYSLKNLDEIQVKQIELWKGIIFIKTSLGKNLTLEVTSTDLIEEIKTKIYAKEGFPPEKQILMFEGCHLENSQCLSSYNIKAESTLQLSSKVFGKMRVFIKNLLNNKSFPLKCDPNETIDKLKSKIQEKEGIPADQQILFFNSKKLNDESTLNDYGVNPDSTVNLIRKSKVSVPVFVRSNNNRRFTLEIDPNDTIAMIKSKIKDIEGIPLEEVVLFKDGQKLENSQSTKDLKLGKETVLELRHK